MFAFQFPMLLHSMLKWNWSEWSFSMWQKRALLPYEPEKENVSVIVIVEADDEDI